MKPHCKPNRESIAACCIDHPTCPEMSALLTSGAAVAIDVATLPVDAAGLYLRCDNSGCSLMPLNHGSGAVRSAFAMDSRDMRARRGKQLLVKAIGGGALRPNVVDATAGLGRDAALLQAFGFPVVMLERDAVLHALLARDLVHHDDGPRLFHTDAIDWLRQPPADVTVDTVYLDPMFAGGGGGAAVKKELAYLRELVDDPGDETALLDAALAAARYRVVVKRAVKAAPLAQRPASFAVAGKAIRFDVYALRAYP